MAYCLALSIKASQSNVNNISIGVDDPTLLPEKYKQVFDQIIEIPWNDDSQNAQWKIHNEWKSYWMTPYDETVKLDADMLFLDDISWWWDNLSSKNCWIASNVQTFKGETITSDYYRKEFTSNNLPNVYTAFMYFNKSIESKELFYMAGTVYKYWQTFFNRFLDENRPGFISTDVAFALAIDLLDAKHSFINPQSEIPTFVHMKPHIQNTRSTLSNWIDELGVYFTPDLQLYVGNFRQSLPFHYQKKEFLTNKMIQYYERFLGI